jgi:nitroimidazol reductase NimA-like FMN-containing flavoprotein (pyridoxamine 5'-phosphate oxidase superfamily)
MIGKLSSTQIEELLDRNYVGRIACCAGSKIYIVPVSYIYKKGCLIGHSLPGLKIDMMRENPNICFEVDEVQGYTNWKSVIAWGEYRELTEEHERYEAMKLFADRSLYLKISEAAVLPELAEKRIHPRSPGILHPVFYSIALKELTGKYESGQAG